jgi:hypothetical protein
MADDLKYAKRDAVTVELEKLVLANKLRSECVRDLADLFGSRCVVTDAGMTLDEKPIAEAIEALVAARTYTHPIVDDSAARENDELRAQVLAGNITAHGRMLKQDREAYLKFCAETGAKPGKAVTPPSGNEAGRKAAAAKRDNPWSREGWNVTKQGSLVRSLGLAKANEIAAAVGARVGQTRPAQAA